MSLASTSPVYVNRATPCGVGLQHLLLDPQVRRAGACSRPGGAESARLAVNLERDVAACRRLRAARLERGADRRLVVHERRRRLGRRRRACPRASRTARTVVVAVADDRSPSIGDRRPRRCPAARRCGRRRARRRSAVAEVPRVGGARRRVRHAGLQRGGERRGPARRRGRQVGGETGRHAAAVEAQPVEVEQVAGLVVGADHVERVRPARERCSSAPGRACGRRPSRPCSAP